MLTAINGSSDSSIDIYSFLLRHGYDAIYNYYGETQAAQNLISMAQYAHLSDPDPKWLAIASSVPSFDFDDVVAFRTKLFSFWEEANKLGHAEAVASNLVNKLYDLPAELEEGVMVTCLDIKQDGYSIPCRTYVPRIKLELGEKPGDKFPLFYWSFGGGFCLGSLNDNDTILRNLALTLRMTCVSVEYRLAPEHPFPAAIDDAHTGLKWALVNSNSIFLDITKGVLVGGLSAGGNLSAVILHRSLKDDQLRGKITGQVLISPVCIAPTAYPEKWKTQLLSMEQNKNALMLSKKTMNIFMDAYIGGKPENAFNPDISPLLAPSFEGLPPAYIQIVGCDPLRDECFLYEKVLKEAGVQTKVDVYPGVPHAFHAFMPNFELSKKQDVDFKLGIKWLLGRSK